MKTTRTAALIIAASMAGCANTDEALEQNVTNLTEQVNTLSVKVTSLSNEVLDLKAQQDKNNTAVQSAQETSLQAADDAIMANKRIDNVVTSYNK